MIEVNRSECLILNVDDYAPGRYARTKLLKQAGFPVIEATTGKETLELAEKNKPVLILLDVNLPDMNGFDVCKKLRSNPHTASMTIVHVSASSILTQHQVSGLESGADGYLVEPVEPAVLLATVNAFLRARRAEDAMRKSSDELLWFSYRVGHDMSEPLRTITAYAQLVKARLQNREGPEIVSLLDSIAAGALQIRSFMDGVLQYSQAAAGFSRLTPVDCEKMFARVLANLDSAVRDSGAVITRDPLPEVVANEQLEGVFQNLLSNAIKYAQPGVAPEIHVSVRKDPKEWIFSVSDNGMGIAPEFLERIFEVFNRLHGQEIPGNGIGLALARRIVEALRGRIWAESQPGAGSTFFVALPF
ncbi:MAG TPA: ATP-binding protein [Bryobacteraceae bacterium]|jgi:signal transduction histidine kinase|nr:ATP-binding protein [Bryobacteraceae bacterium]